MERRRVSALAVVAAFGAACGEPASGELRITAATPDHGPLAGGTPIELSGGGFAASGAQVRVVIGGREAPLATALADDRLQLVIPFGDRPGDVEVVVLTDAGNARATGVFRYSAPPAIEVVSPGEVLFSATDTRIQVTGSGFLDEGAGSVAVAVGEHLITDVSVESDTRLSFTAPAGRAFLEPEVVIVNTRGTATRPRSFRYVPSLRGGLLLFPRFANAFATFVDPVAATVVPIPWIRTAEVRFTTVVRDAAGAYWGMDRLWRFGRLDLSGQRLESPSQFGGWFPTLSLVNGEHYAIERISLRFGKMDPQTGVFAPIGAVGLPCCSSYGLAFNGATFYATARVGSVLSIFRIDPATGEQGPAVPLDAAAGFHIEEMRFFEGKLYATSRNGVFAQIDPATGHVTPLPVNVGRNTAMEVYEPSPPRAAP